MMSKLAKLRTVALLAAALVSVCAVSGCSREDGESAAKISPAAPESYMNDTAFTATLKTQNAVRCSIMKRVDQVRKQYAEAQAKSPDGAEARKLKAKLDELETEFQENNRRTRQIVRERLLQVKPQK